MDSMIPRITVPGKEDRATVVAALMHYSHDVAVQYLRDHDVVGLIKEQRIIVDLLEDLVRSVRADLTADQVLSETLSQTDFDDIRDIFRDMDEDESGET
jgi:predicted transcriptional regulator